MATAAMVLISASMIQGQSPKWFGGAPWSDWERATGNWAGTRDPISGLEFNGFYIADYSSVWDGGAAKGTAYRSLTDINVGFDLEKLADVPGLSFFLDGYVQVGPDGSAAAGDIQAYSNIDGPNLGQIAELFVEQRLFSDRVRIKIGKLDANSEFNTTAEDDFMHSSATLTPSIAVMPTYPDPAMSVNAFYEGDGLFAGIGVYDGATSQQVPTGSRGPSTFFRDERADSYFWIAESGWRWSGGERKDGHALVGVWRHTATFTRFDGGTAENAEGIYFQAQQRILRETHGDGSTDELSEQGMRVFAMLGFADESLFDIERHYALGATYTGLLPTRDADVMGLFCSHVDLSDDPSAGYSENETAFEWFYKIQATGSFSVTPDLQYIISPSGDAAIDHAFVGSLRFVVNF